MPRSDRGQAVVDGLAAVLLAHVGAQSRVDPALLHADALRALAADDGVQVVLVGSEALPPGCSVAAFYDPSASPPALRVARDASPGRRAFSALHEYAHHLRSQVPELLLALLDEPDQGRALEEDVCDAFAALVLAPPDRVAALLPDGVTAAAVLRLMAALPASRQACAVAAARCLPSPGYVMLLDRDGTAVFTASHGGIPPVRRGTAQDDPTVVRAATAGSARGTGRVRVSPGAAGYELLVDAARDGRTAVLVAVTDSPAWGGLTVGRQARVEGATGRCASCDQEFVIFVPPCAACGEPVCPSCGDCHCPSGPAARGARDCAGCGLTLPPAAFASPRSTACADCD